MQFGSRKLQFYNTLTYAGIAVSKSEMYGEEIEDCNRPIRPKGQGTDRYVDGFCSQCSGPAICDPLGPDVYRKHRTLFRNMMKCESLFEAASYHSAIHESAEDIRGRFRARQAVPDYKCPAVDVAPHGPGGSHVQAVDILVRGGEAADGPKERYTFQYTFCPYPTSFRAGEGHFCCPKHLPDFEDLISNHEQLGRDYKAACQSAATSKIDFSELSGHVRNAWIQYEGQLYFTEQGNKQRDAAAAPKISYIDLAPPSPPRPLISARHEAYIQARRKARLETTSRSEASRQRQLQAADIGGDEVNTAEGRSAPAPDTPQGGNAPQPTTSAAGSQAGSGTKDAADAGHVSKKSRKSGNGGNRELASILPH